MRVDENRGALAFLIVTLCAIGVLVWFSSRDDYGPVNAPPGPEARAQRESGRETDQKPSKGGTKSGTEDGGAKAEPGTEPGPAPKSDAKATPDAKPAPRGKPEPKAAPKDAPKDAAKPKAPKEAPKPRPVKTDYEKQIQGTWREVAGGNAGAPAGVTWTFQAGVMVARIEGKETARWAYTIDGTRSPPHLDFYTTEEHPLLRGSALTLGVFGLVGDDLTLAFTYAITDPDGKPLPRPATLDAAPTTPHRMLFKRAVGQ